MAGIACPLPWSPVLQALVSSLLSRFAPHDAVPHDAAHRDAAPRDVHCDVLQGAAPHGAPHCGPPSVGSPPPSAAVSSTRAVLGLLLLLQQACPLEERPCAALALLGGYRRVCL